MRDPSSPAKPARHLAIPLLVAAIVVAALGWMGFLPFGSNMPKDTLPQEASWESQLAAVKNGGSDRIEVTQRQVGDDQLRQLEGLEPLRELLLDKGTMTAAGLASLAKLPKLAQVRIRGARIDDDGFRQLCKISSLQRLNVPQADLTNDGLQSIAQLQQLESFRFGSPRVTDEGIGHIAQLDTIRWLHLIDLPLGDASLQTIATHFPQLESLYIDGGQFSDAAWDEFFKQRPGLHVHVDQKHHDRDPHGHSHSH